MTNPWRPLATDLFNLVMGDFEWVRAQGGRHSVCPLCHAVCERDGGPGHLDDCQRIGLARRFDAATDWDRRTALGVFSRSERPESGAAAREIGVNGLDSVHLAAAPSRSTPAPQAEALTFARFSEINRLRCESPDGFNHKLENWSTSDWVLAALGELGEAANIAKKLNRYRDGIPGNKEPEAALRDNLRKELGDVYVYLDLLAQSLGINIGAAAVEVFNAKSEEIGCSIRIDLAAAFPAVEATPLSQAPMTETLLNDRVQWYRDAAKPLAQLPVDGDGGDPTQDYVRNGDMAADAADDLLKALQLRGAAVSEGAVPATVDFALRLAVKHAL